MHFALHFTILYIYYLLLSENIFGKGGAGLTCPNKTEVVETLDPIDAADRLLPRLPTWSAEMEDNASEETPNLDTTSAAIHRRVHFTHSAMRLIVLCEEEDEELSLG